MEGTIAYVTDLEGRWDKLVSFTDGNPHVSLDAGGALRLADDVTFVFGGDAVDRGPHGRRIVEVLLAARRTYGERVVLLAGNRDINKLRLIRELAGEPPSIAPAAIKNGPRGDLLRWIFTNTMGAKDAFEHRRTEIGAADDDAVVQSFLDDVAPGGAIRRYLAECRIAYRAGATLFLHGGITDRNAGIVPESSTRASEVDDWVRGLNDFCARQLRGHEEGRSLSGLLAYQAPEEGSRYNQKSVVYARLADHDGNPRLPSAGVIEWLRASGIGRVVVGHTPSGDCPAIVRDAESDFELVLADNSYGRIERGSQVSITDDDVTIVGATQLDDGTQHDVRFLSRRADKAVALGRHDAATGELVKARFADGDYLLYRGLPEYRVTQMRASASDVEQRALVLAR